MPSAEKPVRYGLRAGVVAAAGLGEAVRVEAACST